MSPLIRHTLAAAIALAVLPLGAAAAPAPPGTAPDGRAANMLRRLDSNGDGRISLDEYLAAATQRFQAIDAEHHGSVDAAAIASSPAALERIDRRAERLVHRLDTAGNGYVTQAEFVLAAQNRFTRLDANGDGRLTPDELAAAHHGHGRSAGPQAPDNAQARATRHFDRLDANHDGVVTADEFIAAAKAMYAKLDVRHDGKVTAADIAASPRAQRRALRVANRLVRRIDANGDGLVTRDEFIAAAKQRFARLDRNGDGFIDAAELAERQGTRHGL